MGRGGEGAECGGSVGDSSGILGGDLNPDPEAPDTLQSAQTRKLLFCSPCHWSEPSHMVTPSCEGKWGLYPLHHPRQGTGFCECSGPHWAPPYHLTLHPLPTPFSSIHPVRLSAFGICQHYSCVVLFITLLRFCHNFGEIMLTQCKVA